MTKSLRKRLLHVPSADWDWRQIRKAARVATAAGSVRALEKAASDVLGMEVVAFGSARAAIAAVLLSGPGGVHRAFVPAYTCVAVPNALTAAGVTPHWVDIDQGPNINFDVVDAKVSIGDAVVVQHTYGVPPDPERVSRLVRLGAFVLEDRAHTFSSQDVSGSAAVFSLEHSKVVTAGQGGLAWVRDPAHLFRLRGLQSTLSPVSDTTAARALRTSALQVGLSKFEPFVGSVASLARRAALRIPPISSPAQTPGEMLGHPASLTSLHPAFATAGFESVRRTQANLEHRRKISEIYEARLGSLVPSWARGGLPYVRQPIVVPDAERADCMLKAKGLDLGSRWFNAPVHPRGSVSSYIPGSAPTAERLACSVLSLPTHFLITPDLAETIASAILEVAG